MVMSSPSSSSSIPTRWDPLARAFSLRDWDLATPAYSNVSSPASSPGSLSSSAPPSTPYSAESDSDSSSAHSSPKAHAHIPRPRNAFIIFRSHYYQRAKVTQTDINQNSLSCAAASAWRALSDEEKKPYRRQAEEEKLTHYKKHPNYVYTPINKAVKRAQRRAKLVSSSETQSVPKPRSSLARRAAARSTKTQIPSVSKSRCISPAFDASDALSTTFVPLDDIPPLDLAQITKSEETECLPGPSNHERIDSQFGFRPDLDQLTLPPIPFPEKNTNTISPAYLDPPTCISTTTDASYPAWVFGDLGHDMGIHAGWNPIQTTLDAYGDCSIFDRYKELGTFPQYTSYDVMDTPFQSAVYPIFSQDGVWSGL